MSMESVSSEKLYLDFRRTRTPKITRIARKTSVSTSIMQSAFLSEIYFSIIERMMIPPSNGSQGRRLRIQSARFAAAKSLKNDTDRKNRIKFTAPPDRAVMISALRFVLSFGICITNPAEPTETESGFIPNSKAENKCPASCRKAASRP